jgi:antirestriction protein ArdC
MTKQELAEQALANARGGMSVANYAAIYQGFTARGIAEADITPRVNVLTFRAWQALGRVVKRGEHGVRIHTFVALPARVDKTTGETIPGGRRPKWTTVFHISQTEPLATQEDIESNYGADPFDRGD